MNNKDYFVRMSVIIGGQTEYENEKHRKRYTHAQLHSQELETGPRYYGIAIKFIFVPFTKKYVKS
jgi:hypothetical protein